MRIPVARQAWKPIAIGAAVAALGLVPALSAGRALFSLGALFVLFCLYFFRDPERALPSDPDKIYATGDGVVLSVAKESGAATTVRIFLSIFDVHVQRAPCAGRIKSVEYKKGSFAAAMRASASENERSCVVIGPPGRPPVGFDQLAGLIARRIETWVKPGDQVAAGERYGIIYFGSQVALHLPPEVRVVVKPGDRVAGAVTVIGEWTKAR